MRVAVRGCPGMGTRWFAKVLRCLFISNISTIMEIGKHNGCHQNSASDTQITSKLLHPNCTREDCVHAVISRHPLELKHGREGASFVWEAYYGAWSRIHSANAVFFRYEDLISTSCTAPLANRHMVEKYLKRTHRCVPMRDASAWSFWNYTNNCG